MCAGWSPLDKTSPQTLQKYFLEYCMQCEWEHPRDKHSLSCHMCTPTWCWCCCAKGLERVCWHHTVRFHVQVCVFCCQASSAAVNTHLHWLPSFLPLQTPEAKPISLSTCTEQSLCPCCAVRSGQVSEQQSRVLPCHAKRHVAQGDQLPPLSLLLES